MTAALTVGEFSRITHLSVKTLRHYHQVGLLEPDRVNPDTGYRYYSDAQIRTAQVIRRLRDLEMPVAEVKAVLSTPEASGRNALIASHLQRLEHELAQTRAAVDSLRTLLQHPTTEALIEHRTDPPVAAVAVEAVVDGDDVLAWWHGALGELHANVAAQDLQPTGPSGGLFASELFQHGRGQAVVFIPVEGPVRAIGRVTSLVVPAAELAVLTHRGPLDDIDLAYGQLGGYAATHEISIDGPLRERYLIGAHDIADADQWRTEVGWPIFRSDTNP